MCVVYYYLTHYIHADYITRCVCSTIICIIIYIQTKLLQCYYREIVNIQERLRDVQDLLITLDLLCLYSNTVP